jgi:hypothetical protein
MTRLILVQKFSMGKQVEHSERFGASILEICDQIPDGSISSMEKTAQATKKSGWKFNG